MEIVEILSDSFLQCVCLVYGVWAAVCALFAGTAWIIFQAYKHLQMFLIKYSHVNSELWKRVNRKLLVVNYRVYRKIFPFLTGLIPIHYKSPEGDRYLELQIVSVKWKGTIYGVFFCGIISTALHLGLKYRLQIISKIEKALEWIRSENVFSTITTNWVAILSLLGIILIILRYCKDKYINNVITQIHDEELKKILIVHKKLFREIVNLLNRLSVNLEWILQTPKSAGCFMPLYWSIENSYPQFSYNEKTQSFEVNDGDFRHASPYPTVVYKEISGQLARIKKEIGDFLETSPYYSTSAVNRYIRGLSGFDIASFAQRYSTDDLICREYVENICNKFPENLEEVMMCSTYSDETKIEKLKDLLDRRNYQIQTTVEETIRVSIEMEEYVKRFSKAFKLKTKRKGIPAQDLLEKMKS